MRLLRIITQTAMELRVEKMERSLFEFREENQIRLDGIKQLWKRRKRDYLRRGSRRDHAPARTQYTPTWYAEEGKYEEMLVDLMLQHLDLGNPTLLLEAMDFNLPKSETKEEENDEREHRDADSIAEVVDEEKEPLPDEVFKHLLPAQFDINPSCFEIISNGVISPMSLNVVSFSGLRISFNVILLSPDRVRSSYCEIETFASSTSTPLPGKMTVSTITTAPEIDLYHRAAALFLSDQTSETVQTDQHHHDATVYPRSDLEPPKSLGAKMKEAIVGNLHVPLPEPPDRAALVAKAGISHDLVVLLLLAVEERNTDGRKKAARAAFMRVSHTFDLMGLIRIFINEGTKPNGKPKGEKTREEKAFKAFAVAQLVAVVSHTLMITFDGVLKWR